MSTQHSEKDYEYTTLMNMLHVSVSKHLLDEHFTLVWANDFYYDTIGYPKAEYEATFHNRPDLFYKSDMEELEKLTRAVMAALSQGKKGYTHLGRLRCKNGEYIWVRMTATFVDEYIDGYQVSYTAMTDVSDIMRMQTEQTVTYNNLPGFVGKYRFNKDMSLTLLDASDHFVEFFGDGCWKNDGDPLFIRNLKRNTAIFAAQQKKLMTGEPVRFMMQLQDQHGSDAWMQISATCVDWQDGAPVYLVIYIDVTNETELRRMQEKLEEQAVELKKALAEAKHANRAKSDFLSHMSHDIRTPMNAIMGMTDIAQAHLDDRMRVRDCLKKISLSSQHLLGLINDVLDMSRIESGKMTLSNDMLSLPDLLENVVAIMQPGMKAKNQNFSIRLQNVRHEMFYSDVLRLRQIFINLLSNASKFTPVDGTVTMHVEEVATGAAGTARFIFSVADTGIGMKPEFLKQLFMPFSREKDSRVDKTEGSGLGMAITKKLVELLGGEITVKSRVGKGTLFTVTLPMQIGETGQADIKFPNLKVIVADDDADMCLYMDETLKKMGIHVDSAKTGAEAVDKIMAAHDTGKDYDMVFLDWKMPGLDGPATAGQIREKMGGKLPILIVSAYDWSDIEAEAQAAGVDGFIAKPLFVSTLCRALQRYAPGERYNESAAQTDSTLFTGRHFLLVEDNGLNREVATELLSSCGAHITSAYNGVQGIVEFKDSPVDYYDLILMDVQMPVMDGYEATRQIRALDREDAKTVAILAMTADAFAEDISKAKEVGMNGHLAKPLDAATMKREIQKMLQ